MKTKEPIFIDDWGDGTFTVSIEHQCEDFRYMIWYEEDFIRYTVKCWFGSQSKWIEFLRTDYEGKETDKCYTLDKTW